jgi:hypothetical protein
MSPEACEKMRKAKLGKKLSEAEKADRAASRLRNKLAKGG